MDNAEKLAQRCREMGVISQHVSWTEAGQGLSSEEQAGVILAVLDEVERQAADTVAVPVVQMVEIHQALTELTRLGQATAAQWLAMGPAEADLRRRVFDLAESAAMFAGNWVPRD